MTKLKSVYRSVQLDPAHFGQLHDDPPISMLSTQQTWTTSAISRLSATITVIYFP